jgi:hypothetical protein
MPVLRSHNGHDILLDEIDLEWARQWTWCTYVKTGGHIRAQRCERIGNQPVTTMLTRAVAERMGLDCSGQIDHVNRNTLDNQRANLRAASRSQNGANSKKRVFRGQIATSIYKGVSWYKRQKKWIASIREDDKLRFLGYYSSEEDAARAYDTAATRIHGEFARLNFPNT